RALGPWLVDRSAQLPWVIRVGGVFFFSSRRRHTRSKRDWSSDVCSSDLPGLCAISGPKLCREQGCHVAIGPGARVWSMERDKFRSEERRVGKEGGAGGGRADGRETE